MQKMIVSYVKQNIEIDLRHDAMFAFGDDKMLAAVGAIDAADGYEKVAAIEFDDKFDVMENLEHVYKLMQNGIVTSSWTLAPPDGLEPLVSPHVQDNEQYGHRSMSMGDLVQVGDTYYVVASVGFLELPKPIVQS